MDRAVGVALDLVAVPNLDTAAANRRYLSLIDHVVRRRARRDQTDQRRRRLPDPGRHRVYQFGWDGSAFWHLSEEGGPIPDWAGHERVAFTRGNGVGASRLDPAQSLFL